MFCYNNNTIISNTLATKNIEPSPFEHWKKISNKMADCLPIIYPSPRSVCPLSTLFAVIQGFFRCA